MQRNRKILGYLPYYEKNRLEDMHVHHIYDLRELNPL